MFERTKCHFFPLKCKFKASLISLSAFSGCGPFDVINIYFSTVSCSSCREEVSIDVIDDTCASTEHLLKVLCEEPKHKVINIKAVFIIFLWSKVHTKFSLEN